MTFPPGPPPVVAVIGAGFSGLMTAIHLLRGGPDLQVRLIERGPAAGRGKAYGTADLSHLLNVRASNMSAFPDRPRHFQDWLAARGLEAGGDAFVSRCVYGDYLHDLLREAMGASRRLHLDQDEAVALERCGGRWRIGLASGEPIEADAVVLAVGLMPPVQPAGAQPGVLASPAYVGDPWAADLGALPHGDVLLIGAGLTMVDAALSLSHGERRLLAVSRRGLVSMSHAAVQLYPAPDGPFDTPLEALRTLRAYAARVGWRQAVDSVRPITQSLWRSWSLKDRRRFLRHLQPWWDVRRHRMAPLTAERIAALEQSGHLTVAAGRIEALAMKGRRIEARIRRRGAVAPQTLVFDAVVNCMAPQGDAGHAPSGLIAQLQAAGLARGDPLRLGLDVDDALCVLGKDGAPSPGLVAAGPLTRGLFWETVAVPDLRRQTAQAAQTVLMRLHAPAEDGLQAGAL